MKNKIKTLFIVTAVLTLLSGCKTVEIKPLKVLDKNELHHSISNAFDLKLLKAIKQVDPAEYYYESVRWISEDGKIEAKSIYHYLLDNYVFAEDTTENLDVVLKELFEDRVTKTGELNRLPNSKFGGSYIVFETESASCVLFRRIEYLNSASGELLNMRITIGDAKLTAYLCDYSGSALSDKQINQFVTGTSMKTVLTDTINNANL